MSVTGDTAIRIDFPKTLQSAYSLPTRRELTSTGIGREGSRRVFHTRCPDRLYAPTGSPAQSVERDYRGVEAITRQGLDGLRGEHTHPYIHHDQMRIDDHSTTATKQAKPISRRVVARRLPEQMEPQFGP